MSKQERSEAEFTLALTLRGATNGSSKAATDAAIASLVREDVYDEMSDELWHRISLAILDAGIHFAGVLTEPDRERLIGEICQRLGEALRAPAEEDGP
jgi:hypothetical protein